jgi:hypothetical protein
MIGLLCFVLAVVASPFSLQYLDFLPVRHLAIKIAITKLLMLAIVKEHKCEFFRS